MTIQYVSELAGTFFFAISGVLATEDKDRNWFGATFTGFVTAFGGGSLRDMLLGSYSLVWVSDVNFLYATICGVIASFFLFSWIVRLKKNDSCF